MAIYEFACQNTGCGKSFDLMLPMDERDTARPRCPVCEGETQRVLFPLDGAPVAYLMESGQSAAYQNKKWPVRTLRGQKR